MFQDMIGNLKPQLEAILPVFLKNPLRQIEIDSGVSPKGDADPPASTCPKPKNSVVGLQMRLDGAKQVFDKSLVGAFKALLPGLLSKKIQEISLPQAVQNELLKLVADIDLEQKKVTEGLWLYITFPAVPSSYIALYEPLFKKYVVTDTVGRVINEQLKKIGPLFASVCKADCTITQFGLIGQNKVTPKPTRKPTKPTKKPTLMPTKKPTLTPTKKPTTKKPTRMPTNKPTTAPPTPATAPPIVTTAPPLGTAPPPSTVEPPTVVSVQSASRVNTLTPGFFVLIAGVAAFV